MTRSIFSAAVGIALVVIWVTLGAWVAIVAALVGALGFAIGAVLDKPQGLIEFLQRLER